MVFCTGPTSVYSDGSEFTMVYDAQNLGFWISCSSALERRLWKQIIFALGIARTRSLFWIASLTSCSQQE